MPAAEAQPARTTQLAENSPLYAILNFSERKHAAKNPVARISVSLQLCRQSSETSCAFFENLVPGIQAPSAASYISSIFAFCRSFLSSAARSWFGLVLLQFFFQLRLHVFKLRLARRRVLLQPHDGVGLPDLNHIADVARLHGEQRLHNLRRQLVGRDGLVLAHHHAVIVIGDLLRQQAELFGRLGRLGLAQRLSARLRPSFNWSAVALAGGRTEIVWKVNDSGCWKRAGFLS